MAYVLRRHSKTDMKGGRSGRLQLFRGVFHLPSLQFRHQKSCSPRNHGDDSPGSSLLCSTCYRWAVVFGSRANVCLLVPGLPGPTHACELGVHAPAQPPSACTRPPLARRRTPLAARQRDGVENCNDTVERKEGVEFKKRGKIAQKGFLFYLYSQIYPRTRT